MEQPFTLKARVRSFKHAGRGLWVTVTTQHNAWIHLLATIAAIVLSVACGLSRWEWCVIIFATALVWITETLNTAVELLADAVTLERHPLIRGAKDVAAGAVLVAALGALVVAGVVFVPHLAKL